VNSSNSAKTDWEKSGGANPSDTRFAFGDGAQDSEDSLVYILSTLWRFRILCLVIIIAGACFGVATKQRSFPFRTTLALRLVSPCVSYRHTDFWDPASQVWRSQLGQTSWKYYKDDLQITVRMGEKPWLLTVVADHMQTGAAESVLRDLAAETESQLFGQSLDEEVVTSPARAANDAAMNPDSLMVELCSTLTQLEELLAACETKTGDNKTGDNQGAVRQMTRASHFDRPHQMSGTLSSVPIESVPYYPWFDSLHDRACYCLSQRDTESAEAKPNDLELQAVARKTERAAMLLSKVWLSMDPLNPVHQLPGARIQSIIEVPQNKQHAVMQGGILGAWFGLVAAVVTALVAAWLSAHWREILANPKLPGID
jgi:hypothetical protein